MDNQTTIIERLGEKNGAILIKFPTTDIPVSVSKRYFDQLLANDLYKIVTPEDQSAVN